MAAKVTPVKKAPAKKAAPVKKAPTAKAAAKKATPAAKPTKDTSALRAQIVKRRNNGESVAVIAADLGLNSVTVHDYFIEATVSRVKENATPARIKSGRDKDGHSWKVLSVMYGITKAQAQAMYEESGGNPKASTVAKTTSAPRAKKAPAPSAGSKPVLGAVATATGPLTQEEKDAVAVKVEGKTITRINSAVKGAPVAEELKVVGGTLKVGHLKDGTRVIGFNDGAKTRTVSLASIVKVGR